MTTPTASERFHCEDCDSYIDPDDVGPPLYHCGTCGLFNRDQSANDNHQCASCSKFGAKVADASCPECETGELAADLVTVYTIDVDGHEIVGPDIAAVTAEAAQYAADHTPDKVAARKASADAAKARARLDSERRQSDFARRADKIARVLTECGMPDVEADAFVRIQSLSMSANMPMPVFLAIIDRYPEESP